MVFCFAMALSNTVYLHDPALYIWNDTRDNPHATYLSDRIDSWTTPPEYIVPHQLYRANLNHNLLYNTAIYRVVIGSKMGKFFCTATLKIAAFSEVVTPVNVEGNCHYAITKQGKLELVLNVNQPQHKTNLL
jgi:hypothetical protein